MGMLLINSLEPGATLHDGISFYRKQKKSITGSIKEETQKRIAARIPAYKINKD